MKTEGTCSYCLRGLGLSQVLGGKFVDKRGEEKEVAGFKHVGMREENIRLCEECNLWL